MLSLQLEDAMAAASDVLLVSAIQLATDAGNFIHRPAIENVILRPSIYHLGMVYLDELTRAKVALDNIRHRYRFIFMFACCFLDMHLGDRF